MVKWSSIIRHHNFLWMLMWFFLYESFLCSRMWKELHCPNLKWHTSGKIAPIAYTVCYTIQAKKSCKFFWRVCRAADILRNPYISDKYVFFATKGALSQVARFPRTWRKIRFMNLEHKYLGKGAKHPTPKTKTAKKKRKQKKTKQRKTRRRPKRRRRNRKHRRRNNIDERSEYADD